MTLIIQNHWGMITGTFTSIIDTYLNLKEFNKDVDLITISDKKPSEIIKLFFKNSKFGCPSLMKSFTNKRVFDSEVVICSARLLALARKKYGIGPNFDLAVTADECIFLTNPANKGITKFKEYVYYHKFNKKRLDLKHFPQRKLNYSRSKKKFLRIEEGKYFENIGKGVLEHLYKGYVVNYSTDGMFTRDGLCCYLGLLGIDSTRNYKPLVIPKWKIEKYLFMNKNDLLLELI